MTSGSRWVPLFLNNIHGSMFVLDIATNKSFPSCVNLRKLGNRQVKIVCIEQSPFIAADFTFALGNLSSTIIGNCTLLVLYLLSSIFSESVIKPSGRPQASIKSLNLDLSAAIFLKGSGTTSLKSFSNTGCVAVLCAIFKFGPLFSVSILLYALFVRNFLILELFGSSRGKRFCAHSLLSRVAFSAAIFTLSIEKYI